MADSDATRVVLVLDTATDAVITGVAEISTGSGNVPSVRVLAERVVADHRRHAELLTTLMAESLAQANVARDDLAAVVVGTGPGPFTGLRVGMATGAAFADALDIPAYGVCSLDSIGVEVTASVPAGGDVLAVTDARRREVYWATYRDGVRTRGPEVAAPAVVAELLAATPVEAAGGSPAHLQLVGYDGPGAGVSTSPVSTSPVSTSPVTAPSVAGLARVAADRVRAGADAEPLVPLYLRRPDAVERRDQKPKAALP